MAIDYAGLNARLIPRLRELLPEWFPNGRIRGREFILGSIQGESGESLSINLGTGIGKDFATGEPYGDPIALYAASRGLSMSDAARQLGADERPNGLNGSSHVPRETQAQDDPPPPGHAPVDPPPTPSHPKHGYATQVWFYYLLDELGAVLAVCRFDHFDGKKSFLQYTWRADHWWGKSYPAPRPLYRLRELVASTLPVLIVEGEKAADAAQRALPSHIVVTWAGGSHATKQTDWSPLAGRHVVIWPDADEPGREAARKIAATLISARATVSVVQVDDRPEGWDAANAVDESVDISALIHSAKTIGTVTPITDAKKIPRQSGSTHVQAGGSSAFVSWEAIGLDCNPGGVPHPTLANASLVIQRHPDLTNQIWFDTFRAKVFRVVDGHDRQWTDHDDIDMTVWMQQSMRLPKMGLGTVRDAVSHAARQRSRHSLRDYLNALVWDERPRLEDWLCDCLGVDRTPYTVSIARNWPVAMIARAFRPGIQADNMPVLEGKMGKGKSTFLELLGSPWYASLPEAFGSKDFLQAIQGCWLIEVPDMTGFSKREHTHILAIITQRNDRYRATWGRHVEDHPRVSIFGATSETDDYLQDARGRRRYWPLRCVSIDLDALMACRDQVFAEALALYRAGSKWYEMPTDDTLTEQDERVTRDPWQELVERYCSTASEIQVETILTSDSALDIPKERQSRREVMRVTAILREMGWKRAWPKDSAGKTRAVWMPGVKR